MGQRKAVLVTFAAEVAAVAILYLFIATVPIHERISSVLRIVVLVGVSASATVTLQICHLRPVGGGLQFSLKTLLAITAAMCTGIVGLSYSGFGFSHSQYGPGFFEFIGGLALAGGSFGSVVGAIFRQPLLCGAVGAAGTPAIGFFVVIVYFFCYGPRC